jgi:glycerol-3-phosphate dehydrogenase
LAVAERGPASLAYQTRRRLAFTYGDQIQALFARIDADQSAAGEIAPGVTRAELEHAVENEDAMTAEDFLLRRTKLHLTLDPAGRESVARWFAACSALSPLESSRL